MFFLLTNVIPPVNVNITVVTRADSVCHWDVSCQCLTAGSGAGGVITLVNDSKHLIDCFVLCQSLTVTLWSAVRELLFSSGIV